MPPLPNLWLLFHAGLSSSLCLSVLSSSPFSLFLASLLSLAPLSLPFFSFIFVLSLPPMPLVRSQLHYSVSLSLRLPDVVASRASSPFAPPQVHLAIHTLWFEGMKKLDMKIFWRTHCQNFFVALMIAMLELGLVEFSHIVY